MKAKKIIMVAMLLIGVCSIDNLRVIAADIKDDSTANGELGFTSVPKKLSFGKHESFYDKKKSFGLEGTYNDLVVRDTRDLAKNPHWKLTAQLDSNFIGENTGNVMTNVLYFNNQLISSNSVVVIAEQSTINGDEVDLSNKLHGASGLQLRIQPQQIKSDHYQASMTWMLSDGIDNS